MTAAWRRSVGVEPVPPHFPNINQEILAHPHPQKATYNQMFWCKSQAALNYKCLCGICCLRSCWEAGEWFEAHQDCIPLWGGVPAVDILSLSMDMMHIKWLGVDSYFIGSLLCYLIDMKMPDSPQNNLSRLWDEIKVMYAQQKASTRFSTLTLTMFRAGKHPFPCLKGKAGEIKSLIPVLVEVTRPYLVDSDFEKLMYDGLLQSFAIDQCLAESGTSPRPSVGCLEDPSPFQGKASFNTDENPIFTYFPGGRDSCKNKDFFQVMKLKSIVTQVQGVS